MCVVSIYIVYIVNNKIKKIKYNGCISAKLKDTQYHLEVWTHTIDCFLHYREYELHELVARTAFPYTGVPCVMLISGVSCLNVFEIISCVVTG